MDPVIVYCYDAYCNWCYAFSPIMQRIAAAYGSQVQFEVLSGGMILPETPKPISIMAEYFLNNCKAVTEATGTVFGDDFLWHLKNPELSDWFPNSEKNQPLLCAFSKNTILINRWPLPPICNMLFLSSLVHQYHQN